VLLFGKRSDICAVTVLAQRNIADASFAHGGSKARRKSTINESAWPREIVSTMCSMCLPFVSRARQENVGESLSSRSSPSQDKMTRRRKGRCQLSTR
jgi:hypothetical protein